MILIITHKKDYTADFVINKLNKRGIPYERLNCEDLDASLFSFEIEKEFIFCFKNCSKFHSAWFRRTKLPAVEKQSKEETHYLLAEYDALIKNILSSIKCSWLSEPRNIYYAENKTVQLKKAKELGFNMPATLITNDKVKIKDFFNRHNENIIVKPISGNRINYKGYPGFIFTNKVHEDMIDSLEEFDINPCIFQENIEKDYEIRAIVVGNEVFAAACDSQKDEATKIDWRRKKLLFREIELPKCTEDLCISLVGSLGLGFGALDLIKTKTDEYYFLEVNPNGQWAWIELQTNQPISDTIINRLCNNRCD